MITYEYECLNSEQKLIKGQVRANNINEAVDMLKQNNFTVIEIDKLVSDQKRSSMSREKKVSIMELSVFTRQFATMIASGVPISRALVTMSEQSSNPTLKSALENIASNIEGGMSLSDAFSAHPKIFSALYISMLYAGETGGMLENSLFRLADQLEKEKMLKDDVKSATSYPKVVGIFALVIFIGMLVFLVPVFEGFLPDNINIPGITKFIFKLSHSIRDYYYIWIAAIVAIIAGIIAFFKSKTGHDLWEQNKTTMPIFGPIILKSVIARFTRTLATLVEGGIPIVQALESSGPTSGSEVLAKTIERTIINIEQGKSIASTLAESDFFPPLVTHMIAVGEEAGSLPSMLNKIAEFYEQEVATASRGLQALLQPLMLIVIGALVGGMLIALYLPIFTAATSAIG